MATTSTAAEPSAAQRVTKRKLQEAIASLDSALSPSPSAASTAPSTKRRRAIPSTLGLSTPLLLSLLPSSAPSTRPAAPTAAHYDPTSLPALLSRLQTYTLTRFSPSKPASLSPPALALQGWQSAGPGRDRVQCVTCSRGVVLAGPSEGGWSSVSGTRLAEEYVKQVGAGGTAHEGTCPWRVRGGQRSMYRVQVPGRGKLVAELGDEVRRLKEAGLGGMRVDADGVGMSEEERTQLVSAVRGQAEGDAEEELVWLALFGWSLPPSSASSTTPPIILHCRYCHRQILLSSYLPSSSASTTAEGKRFNPLTSHAPYCPNIDPFAGLSPPASGSTTSLSSLADLGGKSKAGWKMRVENILGPQQERLGGGVPEQGRDGDGAEKREKRTARELMGYVRGLLGPKR